MKKAIILISCWFMALGVSYSQSYNTYPELNKFKSWGITGEIGFYPKAELTPVCGTLDHFRTFPTKGYKVGIEYDFYPANKWSCIVGFLVKFDPMIAFSADIASMDYFTISDTIMGGFCFNAPILLSYKQRVYKNIYLDFRAGFHFYLLEPIEGFGFGGTELSIGMERNKMNVLGGSFVMSIGGMFDLKYILLKAHVSYSLANMDGIHNGEYDFVDDIDPANNAGGYIKQSGNYLGLSLSFNLKKFKYKLDKQL
ncbi:MAG: hypothetical protein LBO06_03795 [Bacteroidales bacterium]|jgi:hypothetical protein|nr:hypothetical protein [Bacteroidales bacterium]